MTVSKIKYPFVSYGIISINLLIFLLQFFSGDSSLDPLIALKWGANFAPLTLGHDWWRLITSMFVHYGIFHLLVNMFSLYQIGRKLEKDIGAAGLLFVYFTTGLLGGLLSLYWNLFVFSAGASGAIFGLFGFEVASELIRNKDDLKRIRFILINFFIYISVIFFLGTQFPFDNAAHLGGLVFGVVIAFLYRYFTRWAFPIKVASLLTTVILILIGYYYMPRYQKTYFEIGQKALFTEKRANQISDGDYTSDAVFVKDMKTLSPSWDSVLFSLDSLKNIPAGLAEDKVTLYKYAELKGLEIDYMATCIDQERYIYFDSLDIVREAMRNMPRAKYVFNLTPQPKDTLPNQELDSPKEVVKEYYDSIWRPSSAWNAKYYRIGYQDSLGTWDGLARDYYLNGNVQMRGGYENGLRDGVFIYYSEDNQYEAAGIYRGDRKVGKWEYFHDNGVLSQEIRHQDKNYVLNAWSKEGILQVKEGDGVIKEYHSNGVLAKYEVYHEGLQDSISYGYHENGELYYQEFYNRGDLIQGVSYSMDNATYNYDISTYIPQPAGGMDAFRTYTNETKNRRKGLWSEEVGTVELIFSLTEEGEVFDIRVLDGINQKLNEFAKEMLRNGPKWIPGKLHGQEPINVEGYVVIRFP